LARAGLGGQLLTDGGPVAGSAMFEDVLLDALSVVRPSHNRDFARTLAPLTTIEGGMIVLIAGQLSEQSARKLAAARRDGRQAIAILLATSTWAEPSVSRPPEIGPAAAGLAETGPPEAVLRAAGWRVVTVDSATPLQVAWQRLPRFGSLTGPVTGLRPDQAPGDAATEAGVRPR
nr:hypothetical protein [Actinomycetota bacterium]